MNKDKMIETVAVIYGSDSSEWEVSVRSGEFTASQIDGSRYDVYEIFARFGTHLLDLLCHTFVLHGVVCGQRVTSELGSKIEGRNHKEERNGSHRGQHAGYKLSEFFHGFVSKVLKGTKKSSYGTHRFDKIFIFA